MTGEKIKSKDAFNRGFISSLADDIYEMDKIIDHYTSMIHSNAPKAVSKVKEILNKTSLKDHNDNIKYVKQVFLETVHSDEAKYGIECFKKRKNPNWDEFYNKLKSKL